MEKSVPVIVIHENIETLLKKAQHRWNTKPNYRRALAIWLEGYLRISSGSSAQWNCFWPSDYAVQVQIQSIFVCHSWEKAGTGTYDLGSCSTVSVGLKLNGMVFGLWSCSTGSNPINCCIPLVGKFYHRRLDIAESQSETRAEPLALWFEELLDDLSGPWAQWNFGRPSDLTV